VNDRQGEPLIGEDRQPSAESVAFITTTATIDHLYAEPLFADIQPKRGISLDMADRLATLHAYQLRIDAAYQVVTGRTELAAVHPDSRDGISAFLAAEFDSLPPGLGSETATHLGRSLDRKAMLIAEALEAQAEVTKKRLTKANNQDILAS
jgi:hypothetical protein